MTDVSWLLKVWNIADVVGDDLHITWQVEHIHDNAVMATLFLKENRNKLSFFAFDSRNASDNNELHMWSNIIVRKFFSIMNVHLATSKRKYLLCEQQ